MRTIIFLCLLIIGLSALDIGTTVYLRDSGFVEMNPFAASYIESILSLIVLKIIGLTICFSIILYSFSKNSFSKNRFFGNVQTGIVVLVSAAACINNIRYMVII